MRFRLGLTAALLVCAATAARSEEALAPPAPPPGSPVSPQPPAPAPAPSGYPFEAEVNATNVHVRAGGNINERVLKDLAKGEKVTVLEEQYGWYRIPCPQGCKGWVSAKFAAEAPGVDGAPPTLTLTGDNVQLRASDSPKATPMGSFPKGTTFSMVRKHGEWYEVLCPHEATAWVNAKYVAPLNGAVPPPLTVKAGGETPAHPKPPAHPVEPSESSAEAKAWAKLEAEREAMMKKPFEQMDLDKLIAAYQALAGKSPGALSERCKARVQELSEKKEVRDQIRAGISQAEEDLQKKLDEINARYEARVNEIVKKHHDTPSESEFVETGWVAGIGRMMGCPGTHRLNKGGRHLCYLCSAKDQNGKEILDLERYRNQYVGLLGDRVQDPEWGEMILVKEVQVLGEPVKP